MEVASHFTFFHEKLEFNIDVVFSHEYYDLSLCCLALKQYLFDSSYSAVSTAQIIMKNDSF